MSVANGRPGSTATSSKADAPVLCWWRYTSSPSRSWATTMSRALWRPATATRTTAAARSSLAATVATAAWRRRERADPRRWWRPERGGAMTTQAMPWIRTGATVRGPRSGSRGRSPLASGPEALAVEVEARHVGTAHLAAGVRRVVVRISASASGLSMPTVNGALPFSRDLLRRDLALDPGVVVPRPPEVPRRRGRRQLLDRLPRAPGERPAPHGDAGELVARRERHVAVARDLVAEVGVDGADAEQVGEHDGEVDLDGGVERDRVGGRRTMPPVAPRQGVYGRQCGRLAAGSPPSRRMMRVRLEPVGVCALDCMSGLVATPRSAGSSEPA